MKSKLTISDIGEFGLIERIHQIVGDPVNDTTFGIGDDTAVFRPTSGCDLLLTCDALVEGRHYLPQHIDPETLGRRAMAANLSDIGSMGGQPRYALVSLGLTNSTPVEFVESLYRGFIEELSAYGAMVIGGNLTKVNEKIIIDITLIGEVPRGRAVRRSTAQIGDKVFVTGYPGRSAVGLQLLLNGDSKLIAEFRDSLIQAYSKPEPRVREGQALAEHNLASAMIDISDGFLGDLGHICEASGVGAVIDQQAFPLSSELVMASQKMKRTPFDFALGNSDDYELIFTCHPEKVATVKDTWKKVSSAPLTCIGEIIGEPGHIYLRDLKGKLQQLVSEGWDHFALLPTLK